MRLSYVIDDRSQRLADILSELVHGAAVHALEGLT